MFGKKEVNLSSELKKQFKNFATIYNADSSQKVSDVAKEFREQFGELDDSIVNFAEKCNGSKMFLEDFEKALGGVDLKAKALTLGFNALSVAANMVASYLIAQAAAWTVTAIDNYIHRVEKAKETMEESIDTFQQSTSKVTELTDELKAQEEQIDALLAKDKLSYIEKSELENLKEATTEMKLQLALAEKQKQIDAEQAAEDTVKAYNKEFGKYEYSDKAIEDYKERLKLSQSNAAYDLSQKEGDMAALIAVYQHLNDLKTENIGINDELADDYAQQAKNVENTIYTQLQTLQNEQANLQLIPEDQLDKEAKQVLETIKYIQQEVWKIMDPNKWNSIQLDKVFDTEGLEVTKDDLVAMAKEGTLTEDALRKMPNLQEALSGINLNIDETETNTSAMLRYIRSEVEEIDALAKKLGVSYSQLAGFTEEDAAAIDNFQSKMSSLKTTLESIRSGSFKQSDLTDLLQEFPQLQGQTGNLESAIVNLINNALKQLYSLLGENISPALKDSLAAIADEAAGVTIPLSDALSAIQSSYDAMNEFKKAMDSNKMTDEILSSVGSLSTSLNDMVAGFYAGTVSADQLYQALTDHYNIDLQNYGNALIAKNQYSESFYNAVGLNSAEVVNQFKDDYGIDISNCKTYNQAKIEIERQTLQKISDMWAQYYNATSKSLTNEGRRLQIAAEYAMEHGISNADTQKWSEIQALEKTYRDASEALNNITYDAIGADFGGISSSLDKNSGSGGSDKSDQSKEFDWIERKISLLRDEYSKYKEEVDDSNNSFRTQLNYLSEAEAHLKEIIATEKQAEGIYFANWEKASEGLSDDIKSKIMNGNMSIEEYSSNSDAIDKAMSAWDDYKAQRDARLEDEKALQSLEDSVHTKRVEQLKEQIETAKALGDASYISYGDSDASLAANFDEIKSEISEAKEELDDYKERWKEAQKDINYAATQAEVDNRELIAGIENGTLNPEDYEGNQLLRSALTEGIEEYKQLSDANTRITELKTQLTTEQKNLANAMNNTSLGYYDNVIDLHKQIVDEVRNEVNTAKTGWEEAKQALLDYGKANENVNASGIIADIMNGKADLSQFEDGSELKELVESVINSYGRYENSQKELMEEEMSLEDARKEAYEKAIEYVESQQNEISQINATIQSEMDLINESGGLIIESTYKEMIRNNDHLIELYKDQLDLIEDRLGEVEEKSADYYELKGQMQEVAQEINKAKQEQESWNYEIKMLPIYRIEKFLTILDAIKENLQGFIDWEGTLGISSSKDELQQMIDLDSERIAKLQEQLQKYQDVLASGDYEYGSDKYNELVENINSVGSAISDAANEQQELNQQLLNIPVNKISELNENLQTYQSIISDQLDEQETVISAITGLLQQEMDKLSDKQDKITEKYQEQIDPIDEQLEKLEKQNEALDVQRKKEQALYDLERAKNQKTTKVNKIALTHSNMWGVYPVSSYNG